jgi:hypothetical protein
MGVPTSEAGYTLAMPRREDHEVHKGHVVVLGEKNIMKVWQNELYGVSHDSSFTLVPTVAT